MIIFNFELDAFELSLAKSYSLANATPGTRYYECIPSADFELFIDRHAVPLTLKKLPIISLAEQFKHCLCSIAIGETKRLAFMDDGGFIKITRENAETVAIVDMNPNTPPTRCSYEELKAATVAFCSEVFEVIKKEYPEMLEVEGDLIREVLLA